MLLLLSVLRRKIARLATVQTIILTILAQPHIVLPLAQRAKTFALALRFFFVADHTDKLFRHRCS
jgi:hypothetical protein